MVTNQFRVKIGYKLAAFESEIDATSVFEALADYLNKRDVKLTWLIVEIPAHNEVIKFVKKEETKNATAS